MLLASYLHCKDIKCGYIPRYIDTMLNKSFYNGSVISLPQCNQSPYIFKSDTQRIPSFLKLFVQEIGMRVYMCTVYVKNFE